MENIDPWGGASLDPRSLIGRVYVGNHCILLHTKYISYGPQGFGEEDFFKVFPIVSLWKLLNRGTGPVWTPGVCWQDLYRGPLDIANLLYT